MKIAFLQDYNIRQKTVITKGRSTHHCRNCQKEIIARKIKLLGIYKKEYEFKQIFLCFQCWQKHNEVHK